jgi:hypothetical protein
MMSDLRKAVQDFLTHWDSPQWVETAETVAAIAVMRKALAEPEQSEPVAWLHIPHKTINDKVRPVVSLTKYNEPEFYLEPVPLYTTPPRREPLKDTLPSCNTHPDAPHGCNRTASLSLRRYVCDCEGWTP